MNIYVCDGLDNLKKQLSERGYKVNNVKDAYYDAIICNIKDTNLNALNIVSNVRMDGTLIIDAGNKDIADIEYILNNRAYSSLL